MTRRTNATRWRIVGELVLGVGSLGFGALASLATGDEGPAKAPAKAGEAKAVAAKTVAATVDGEPVPAGEVHYEVRKALANLEVPPATRNVFEARALQQLVDRRVVLAYLQSQGEAAGAQEVERAMQRLVSDLARQKSTLAAHLERMGLDEPALRRKFAWQQSWKAYLERRFTPENLQKFFERRRRDFDGTQLKVAHILFKLDAERSPASRDAALAKARQVREEIAQSKLSFADAAAKHSQAPTARQGGDIGLIARHDPMPESFSKAAFELEKGAVSAPVESEIGVHLITVLDVQPGQKTLQDVRSELEVAFAQYLFERLAEQLRPKAKIEFTGAVPYFDPQTGELRTSDAARP